MNTRFSYNLLQVFSKKRPAGFALPMVVMMGTVVLVVGAAMMVKGMNDQNQVTSQKAKMVANNAAETGMARLQQTLAANPDLATVSMEKWQEVLTAYDSNPNSVVLVQDIYGQNVDVVEAVTSTSCEYAAKNDAQAKSDLIAAIRSMVNTNTTAATLPNSSSGLEAKYQIKKYIYYPDGTAKVQVRGLAGGTNGAQTDLVASFPVQKRSEQAIPTDVFPGLWVKEYLQIGQNDNNPGKLEANVAYDCGIGAGASTNPDGSINTAKFTAVNGNGQTAGYKQYNSVKQVGSRAAISVSLPAGSAPPKETIIPMPDPPASAPTGVTPASLGAVSGSLTLPRPGTDTTSSSNYQSSTQTYYYTASSISGNGVNLQFTQDKKLSFC